MSKILFSVPLCKVKKNGIRCASIKVVKSNFQNHYGTSFLCFRRLGRAKHLLHGLRECDHFCRHPNMRPQRYLQVPRLYQGPLRSAALQPGSQTQCLPCPQSWDIPASSNKEANRHHGHSRLASWRLSPWQQTTADSVV